MSSAGSRMAKAAGPSLEIGPGQFLVIAGKSQTNRMEFHPLIADSGRRAFEGTAIIDHVYIGVRFGSGKEIERVVETPESTKVTDVIAGNNAYRYIGNEALPAGRYAVLGIDDPRVYLIDFAG